MEREERGNGERKRGQKEERKEILIGTITERKR